MCCVDYFGTYEALIRKARLRSAVNSGYYEIHHIIPRSLDGDDSEENLVALTYREHFLAHWLLTKMFEGLEKRKMAFAFYMMTMQIGDRIIAGWQFELVKRLCQQQRLATSKQRRAFLEAQQLFKIKEIVRKAQAYPDDASHYEKLLALQHKATATVVIQGRHYHGDKFLRQTLIELGALEYSEPVKNINKKLSHRYRLALWKSNRLSG